MKSAKSRISNYTVKDLLLDESFIDWIKSGKISTNAWHRHINQYPHLLSSVNEAEQILDEFNFHEEVPHRDKINRIKRNIEFRIEGLSTDTIGFRESTTTYYWNNWQFVLALAGVIGLLVISIFVIQPSKQEILKVADLQKSVKSTGSGQRLTLNMQDGSIVKLNSESNLVYGDFSLDSTRTVYLAGEAYFDVAKDSLKPFKVVTEKTVTTALGTSFVINTNSPNEATTVSLISGEILLETNTSNDSISVKMRPGYAAIVEPDTPCKIVKLDDDLIAWKDGLLVFKQATFEHVFQELEDWYGVEFQITNESEKSLKDWTYTGQFKNENLENVLKSIGYVKSFEYKIEDDKITIEI